MKPLIRHRPNHPDRPTWLECLGWGYRERFQSIGPIEDLEIATRMWQEALDQASANYPDWANLRYSLAIGLHDKVEITRKLSDIERAIREFQEAVDETPTDHPRRSLRLEGLASGLMSKFNYTEAHSGYTEAKANLELSILYSQEALTLTPAEDPQRASRLEQLAKGIYQRYQAEGAIADRELALRLLQEAHNRLPGKQIS